ncbi:MAG: hypothetical protein JHC61_14320, partial [Burkholderiaceae bacterium]|nr:hypothetical protein [Burkholderiaceae bacterium]
TIMQHAFDLSQTGFIALAALAGLAIGRWLILLTHRLARMMKQEWQAHCPNSGQYMTNTTLINGFDKLRTVKGVADEFASRETLRANSKYLSMQPNLAISLLPVDILLYVERLTTNGNGRMLPLEKKG